MRKALALLASVALSGIIGVSAAQADRGPHRPHGRPECPSAHSHGRGHGRGHDRHRCPTTTTSTTAATTTTEDTSTTQVG
ncbi:MAG TPA: hypothetical protein PK748_07830 [Acidimicrobiales bacterium]|mgnify:FL=1|jgi:hypothetical protein|nr:hypothetical protein [Acidimicrobiales bacterium]HMS88354.1 hypothetical protein [Acidimicrobiales bacterium]HRA34822.1 hypothetical protein [Acidimicrobiales bacterium]